MGTRHHSRGASNPEHSALVESLEPRRLLAAGDWDRTFGTEGYSAEDDQHGFAPVDTGTINAIAATPDGGYVLAGHLTEGSSSGQLTVHRFDSNGKPALGFTPFVLDDDADDYAATVFVREDGRIVVGFTRSGQPTTLRLRTDGTLDPTFGNGHGVLHGFEALVMQPIEGRLFGIDGTLVRRFTPRGFPDPTFGGDGSIDLISESPFRDLRTPTIALQHNGKLVVVAPGHLDSDTDIQQKQTIVIRLTDTGATDRSFGTRGVVTWHGLRLGGRGMVAVGPDDRILIANPGSDDRPLLGLDADGKPLANFTPTPPPYYVHVAAIGFDQQGRILALNATGYNDFASFYRYRPDGTPDYRFGGSGASEDVDVPGDAFCVASDGNLLVGGGGANPFLRRIAVARISATEDAAPVVTYRGLFPRYGVFGTSKSDRISVTRSADGIVIDINGKKTTVPLPDRRQWGFTVDAGDGDDVVRFAVRPKLRQLNFVTINGGNGDDHLTLINAYDVSVFGRAGNDVIDAGSFNMTIVYDQGGIPATGGVYAEGGAGNDRIIGSAYRDTLIGGTGDDTLMPGAAKDDVHPGSGRDTLLLLDDHDRLVGVEPEDTIKYIR